MERKLYRGIANPSMITTIFMGVALFYINPDYYASAIWFQIKLLLVNFTDHISLCMSELNAAVSK